MSPETYVAAFLAASHLIVGLVAVLLDRQGARRTPAVNPTPPPAPHPILQAIDAAVAKVGPQLAQAILTQHLPAIAAQISGSPPPPAR